LNFSKNLPHKGELKGIKSNIVHKHVLELKNQYKIESNQPDMNEFEKVIEINRESKDDTFADVEVIYEKFIRLNLLDPKLKKHLRDSFSPLNSYDFIYKIQLAIIENNLEDQNVKFIERQMKHTKTNMLDVISEQFKQTKCVCIHGMIGTGKKELVTEFGWRMVDKEWCVQVFDFNTLEDDFRCFAKENLCISVDGENIKNVLQSISNRLGLLSVSKKFLFIILNVLVYDEIAIYVRHILKSNKTPRFTQQKDSLQNVMVLFTTPHKNLLSTSKIENVQLELNAFSYKEVDEFLSKFYARKPTLDKKQKQKLLDITSFG
jgi:hypothetical protein